MGSSKAICGSGWMSGNGGRWWFEDRRRQGFWGWLTGRNYQRQAIYASAFCIGLFRKSVVLAGEHIYYLMLFQNDKVVIRIYDIVFEFSEIYTIQYFLFFQFHIIIINKHDKATHLIYYSKKRILNNRFNSLDSLKKIYHRHHVSSNKGNGVLRVQILFTSCLHVFLLSIALLMSRTDCIYSAFLIFSPK